MFPDHLVNKMAIKPLGKMLRYRPVCPICGLAIMNRMGKENRVNFDGPIAQKLLLEARAYVKQQEAE